jgi:hypothetical protein
LSDVTANGTFIDDLFVLNRAGQPTTGEDGSGGAFATRRGSSAWLDQCSFLLNGAEKVFTNSNWCHHIWSKMSDCVDW